MLKNVFGVNWRIQVGMGHNDYEYYVEGKYCPKCNCKLMSKTKNSFFGWTKKSIWNCPSCGFEIERPKDYLYYEEDAVENIAKNQYEKNCGSNEFHYFLCHLTSAITWTKSRQDFGIW